MIDTKRIYIIEISYILYLLYLDWFIKKKFNKSNQDYNYKDFSIKNENLMNLVLNFQ